MAGLISPHTLELIRAASDIVEVIGGYFPLAKRVGGNFVALCPFHKEKTPSFHVNPQRQTFHCFGCHKGGDVFSFVKEYENLSFVEAVRRLAERARIPLELETSPGQEKIRFLKENLLAIHEHLCQRWQAALTNDAAGQIARDYLARRGVPEEAIRSFRLGYSPESWDDTVNWAKSRGYELPLVEQAGLVIGKEEEGGGPAHYYDRFRGRLMFPICDEQGRVIAFSGRVLRSDEKTAKYVNSPETPIFTKGKVCYGLDKSKRALLEAGRAVICEGQLDLIACFMAGVQHVVAPQGTALTGDHCRILKRYVSEVVLCFDSDTAGQNAALRALDDLLASGLAIRVAEIPAPHDPDSYIREHGAAAFRQLIERAGGFFDYLLARLCRENDPASDRGRATIVRRMGESVLKTGDAVLLDAFARKTAQILGVGTDAVRLEFRKAWRAAPAAGTRAMPDAPRPAPQDRPGRGLPSVHEFWLLRVVLGHESLLEEALSHLDLAWVEHAAVRQVLAYCFARFAAAEPVRIPAMLQVLQDEETTRLVTEAVALEVPADEAARILMDAIRRLRDRDLERALAELTRRIADGATPAAERAAAIERQLALRRAKASPLHRRETTAS